MQSSPKTFEEALKLLEKVHLERDDLFQKIAIKEAIAGQLKADRDNLISKTQSQKLDILRLQAEVDLLKRKLYGQLRERYIGKQNDLQLSMFDFTPTGEEPAPPPVQDSELQVAPRRKPDPKKRENFDRHPLPEHLPRVTRVIEPEHIPEGSVKIREDITEVLQATPAQLWVERIVRPVYGLPKAEGVIQAQAPVRFIDRGVAGNQLLACLLILKYVDHMPLHRIAQMWKRQGVTIPDSTLIGWAAKGIEGIALLYNALRREVLAHHYLQVDETTIKVLDPAKKGTTHQGYFWAYHAPTSRLVMIEYQNGRSAKGPEEALAYFKGILQTDGYRVYESLDKRHEHIQLLACMAHVRRKFFEAKDNNAAGAHEALTYIRELYGIEEKIRTTKPPPDDILHLRRTQTKPLLDAFKTWLDEKEKTPLEPGSPFGKAIRYALKHWDSFDVLCDNDLLQIDNNLIENVMRPIALGRKNYTFAGSHNAAQRSAMIYSLFETCKKHDINPQQWLDDILIRLPNHPVNRISDLLPHRWKPLQT